jgi:hypothetical protein
MPFDIKLRNIAWYNIVARYRDGKTRWFSKKHKISHGLDTASLHIVASNPAIDRTLGVQIALFYTRTKTINLETVILCCNLFYFP